MNYVMETTVEERRDGEHAEIATRRAAHLRRAVSLGAAASRCVLTIKVLERYTPVAVEIKKGWIRDLDRGRIGRAREYTTMMEPGSAGVTPASRNRKTKHGKEE